MKTIITINGNDLKAVSLFKSTDETRYVLNGVLLEVSTEKEYILTATDGRCLFALHEPAAQIEGFEKPFSVIIPPRILGRVQKSTSKRTRLYTLTIEDIEGVLGVRKQITLYDRREDIGYQQFEIEGFYPKWRTCIPKGEFKSPVLDDGFNPEFAAAFQKAGTLLGKYTGIQLYQTEPHSAFWVASEAWKDRDVIALMMPMRAFATESPKVPEWALQGKGEKGTAQ